MFSRQVLTGAALLFLTLILFSPAWLHAQAPAAATPIPGKPPFIKYREVTLGDPELYGENWSMMVPGSLFRKYAYENWRPAKMHKYVDMIKSFGFNSIQLYDCFHAYAWAGWGVGPDTPWGGVHRANPEGWYQMVDGLADYARKQGLRTTLFIWGNAGFDYRTMNFNSRLDPSNPKQREILELYWSNQAEHATHFDHIVTHWADPGGCTSKGCTIEQAMDLHNQIVARFRARNPKIESSFSLWMLHNPHFGLWSGYQNVYSVLRANVLPPDVGLALDGNSGGVRLLEGKAISDAGRRVGVWGWYLTDNEIQPSWWVRISRLGAAFNDLPPQTSKWLQWFSVDSNSHGLNLQNLYVAGKLMQDPKLDAWEVAREFIAGAYGQPNVPAVEGVFRGIEKIRTRYLYDGDLSLAREIQKLARQVEIPKDFHPAFPLIVSPQELVLELRAQTDVIVQYLEFNRAAQEIEKMKLAGAPRKDIDAAIQKLPQVPFPTDYLTWLEYRYCREKMMALRL